MTELPKLFIGNSTKGFGFKSSKSYQEHQVEQVLENDWGKSLWDFKIQTDRHFFHNMPDKQSGEKRDADVATMGNASLEEKQLEKIMIYWGLHF